MRIERFLEQYSKPLLVAAIVATYLPRLLRSMWLDEAGNYWMARGGPVAAFEKAWHWPGQSLLFAVISSFFSFDVFPADVFPADAFPARDLVTRIPALAAGALLCWFLYRFAEDAFGPGAGRIAAVLGVFHPLTIDFATQARPYTAAMAAVVASFWALLRWVERGERRWLMWSVIASALIVYLHYLFVVAFAAQLLYAILRRDSVRWRQAIPAVAVLCLLVLPLVPHIRLLFRESGTLPFMPPPGVRQFAELLLPPLLAAGLLVASAIWFFGCDRAVRAERSNPLLAMLLAWWLAGPILLYAASTLSPMRLFVPRYLAYSAPASVLLLTWIGYRLWGPKSGLLWALTATLLTTGSPLNIAGIRKPGPEEFGPLVQIVRAETRTDAGSVTPLIYPSELPESNAYDWRAGNAPQSYLFAPFVAYPIANPLIPLPHSITPDATAFLSSQADALANRERVLLIARDPAWVRLILAEFKKRGFTSRWVQPNSFYVAVMEKAP
jgi:uncharacterized membrane protein (DUF485 family)